MLYQPLRSPHLTDWLYFGQKSHRSWIFCTFSLIPCDVTSDRQKSIFVLLNIFLAQEYSFMNFKNKLFNSFWCYISHNWPTFLAKEPSIVNFPYILIDSLWCYISHKVVHIWPNGHISGQRVLNLDIFYTYLMTPSDVTSAIQKSTSDLINIFFYKLVLDHELSITCSLTPSDVKYAIKKSIFNLTDILYIWLKSRWSWTSITYSLTPSDVTSAI